MQKVPHDDEMTRLYREVLQARARAQAQEQAIRRPFEQRRRKRRVLAMAVIVVAVAYAILMVYAGLTAQYALIWVGLALLCGFLWYALPRL